MTAFEDSYLGQLRQLVGSRRLITPAVRAVILDDLNRVLLVRRSDNGVWSLPAGSVELDESVYDALCREVKEETGLEVYAATAIAIYTEPRFQFVNAFGDAHQMFALVFRVDAWQGTLSKKTDETIDAAFFGRDDLPQIPAHHVETLQDLDDFTGNLILK